MRRSAPASRRRGAPLATAAMTRRRSVRSISAVSASSAMCRKGRPPRTRPPAMAEPAEPALSLPSRPSIAVLPFTNMSGDPEQDYFAGGLTEDLITGLSRQRWFFVIARNSSFAYKGEAVDVRKVSAQLGVRYVL